jgi:divalent metal cation (Fe/Co/Zn/Cd) transporter
MPVNQVVVDTRRAMRVSATSVVWTLLAGAAAVVIGLRAHTLALVAFGAIGVLDAAGSVALVVHFRHSLAHDVASARHERIALNVVTAGLFTVGCVTAAFSIHRLLTPSTAESDAAGIVLAAVSVVVLAILSRAKRRLSRRVGSHALHADSWLSAAGALLALVTLAGTALSAAFSWTWVDPAAATVVAIGAIGLGVTLRIGARDE